MGMKIQYVGPKDVKRFNGQLFPRLVPVEVSSADAAKMLAYPEVFLPAEMVVPPETLAVREQLPAAMIREGQTRIEEYQIVKARAMGMPQGALNSDGKPDWVMQKRLDAMQGAQDEIDHGNKLIQEANRLAQRLLVEKAIAAAGTDEPAPEPENLAVLTVNEAPKARKPKASPAPPIPEAVG